MDRDTKASAPSGWSERLLGPIGRLVTALADPARRERSVVLVLLAYVGIWTLYGTLSKSSQDIHVDMSEMTAWSRELALGYPKHPPLGAWITRAWFSVFPTADWAFYLLAMTIAATALWIAWRIAGDFLDAEKRVVALAMLTLVPFFNFHALKFNANTVLLPLWASTTLCFIRSVRTRSVTWAALAGFWAAAAMLGKYWSAFLLAGLLLAALADPRRRAYFRSAAPWVTVAVGAVFVAPHVVWLAQHKFGAFTYAVAGHARSVASATGSALSYLGGAIAYVALPVLLVLGGARPGRDAVRDTLLPGEPDRRLAAVAFWAPLLLPAVAAPFTGIAITSLWSMSAWTLLPVVLLSSPLVVLGRQAVLVTVAVAAALPVVMTAAAPAISIAIHRGGVAPAAAHVRLLADRVAHEWRRATDRPLRLVGGNADLAYGAAFYLPDRPVAFPDFSRRTAPSVTPARIAREGMAVVCFAADAACKSAAGAQGVSGRRTEVEVARSHFGTQGRPARYQITIVPPQP